MLPDLLGADLGIVDHRAGGDVEALPGGYVQGRDMADLAGQLLQVVGPDAQVLGPGRPHVALGVAVLAVLHGVVQVIPHSGDVFVALGEVVLLVDGRVAVAAGHAPEVVDVVVDAVVPGKAALFGVGHAVAGHAVFRGRRIGESRDDLAVLIEEALIIDHGGLLAFPDRTRLPGRCPRPPRWPTCS